MSDLEPKNTTRPDEIDLLQLFQVLMQRRWWIIGITALFGLCGVIYAISLPNLYKSEGVYALAQKQGGAELGGTLGGLASLAGVNVGQSGGNDISQAMVLVTSWPFLEKMIDDHHLKPLIVAVKGWDSRSDRLIWDTDIYNATEKQWYLTNTKDGEGKAPTSYQAFKAMRDMITVNYDAKSGMLTVAVEHFSPYIAKEWVEIIVSQLNQHFQARDTEKAKSSISYLQGKIDETSISEMKSVFYGMIEAQTRTLMLAEAGGSYFLVEVVGPKVSEEKSLPKRTLICVLFVLLGGFFSMFFVLVKNCLLSKK